MVSGYICERYGNVALTPEMVEINGKLLDADQLWVTDSCIVIYPSSKPGSDDYWNTEQMIMQVS